MTLAEQADIHQAFSLLRAGVYLAAILLFCLNHWINRDFGRPDIDQIAYHLQLGTRGLEASDPAIAERFLRTHLYHEVYGKEDWEAQGVPQEMMNGRGPFDHALFSRARAKLDQLHASGQRFNQTLPTVDTHEAAGHLARSCARRGYAGFEGVIRCTAAELAAFLRCVRERGYLADTNIVIPGDHTARRNPLSGALERVPERALFNAFIGAAVPSRNREQRVHFDLLPTILEFGGCNRHGARPRPERLAEMRASLLNRSESCLFLWRDTAARRRPAP